MSASLLKSLLRVTPGGAARQWLRCSTPFFLSRCYASKRMKPVDEGLALGDYPQLPWESAQLRSPRGWWDNQDRRNKEDPLHEQDDMLSMWVWDEVECNGRYTKWQALGQLTIMLSILAGIYGLSLLYENPSRDPCVPRQFPYNDLYLSRGGDPNKPPDEPTPPGEKSPVQATYGEIMS